MNNKCASFLLGLALLGAATSAHAAALNWVWTWTSPNYTMAGTLTTDPAQGGQYIIRSAALSSYNIRGLSSGIALTSLSLDGGADNIIWSSDPTQRQVSGEGFGFELLGLPTPPTPTLTIYADPYNDSFYYSVINQDNSTEVGLFTANLSAVPEPSEWAAISFGVLGLIYMAKRRLGRATH